MDLLERLFKLRAQNASIRTEVLAGVTTFITMAYIIFVNPVILGGVGLEDSGAEFMDFGAVMVATCIAAGVATIFMGLIANYPIALAPGMGENAVFASFVAAGLITWQQGLAATLVSGLVFFLLTFFKIRQMVIDGMPDALKRAIAVGIGVFIAFMGLVNGGIVSKPAGPVPVSMGDPLNPAVWTTLVGLVLVGALMARRVRGAILWGILGTTLFALAIGVTRYHGILDRPPSIEPTFLKLSFAGLLTADGLVVIIVFLFMDVFDSIGTFIGIGEAGGFLRNGRMPRATRALYADATGTVAGAALGTSAVTSYIESAAGVAAGARTGLANVATGLLFLAAVFCYPLAEMIGATFAWQGGFYSPITAPALLGVGCLMMGSVRQIPWDDFGEALPALLIILGIPLTYSIADGLALGLISYPLIKLLAGRGREVPVLIYVLGAIFLARYALVQL
ncbi:MAG: NCS2 family permease [Candidatus Eisenbacteria sp.]|nr:NCS2 family permease [Candidatus Eisenbacteria bacterium]